MRLPKAIEKLINSFEQLPGIGPKTAARLTFYLLHTPQAFLDNFGEAIGNLKKNTVECSICHNVSETDPCSVCVDPNRDKRVICVVEQPLDILSIERTNQYRGVYHVLHGVINPLQNVSPEEIKIGELINRVRSNEQILEIILATGSGMEGEATAMYIAKKIRELKNKETEKIKISRLGQGLSNGTDLEYADEKKIFQALEGRKDY